MDFFTLVRHLRLPLMRRRTRALLVALLLAWAASLALLWWWSAHSASPRMAMIVAENQRLQAQSRQLFDLQQRNVTLKRSDDISRAANQELQSSLSERDEEVSALRADVSFYERLVGTSGQRRGLTVHSIKMEQDTNGTWHYLTTLTQNLNRGKVSLGSMTLQVEGAKGGKLQTLEWDDLLQKKDAPPRDFSFRYFQRVEGTVILPAGFTPHRVRVSLRSEGTTIQTAFPWTDALSGDAGLPDASGP